MTKTYRLLRNRQVVGASLGFFCYNYNKSFFLTWFPAYLVTERHMSLLSVGAVGMIPAVCAIAADIGAGIWTDRAIARGVPVTIARKAPICTGMLLSSIIVVADMVKSEVGVLAILALSFAFTVSASPGIWAIPGDIAPSSDYVGTIGGVQNTVANMAGIVAPVTTGALVEHSGSFALALGVSGILALSGALSYWLVVGELVPGGRTYDDVA